MNEPKKHYKHFCCIFGLDNFSLSVFIDGSWVYFVVNAKVGSIGGNLGNKKRNCNSVILHYWGFLHNAPKNGERDLFSIANNLSRWLWGSCSNALYRL